MPGFSALPALIALGLGAAPLLAQDKKPVRDAGTSNAETSTLGEKIDNIGRSLDDWVERFDLHGFVAARFMDTEPRGRHADGFLGIHQALLFVEADVRDVGTAVIEIELEYFREANDNGTGVNEVYMQFDQFYQDDETYLGLKIGRFELPFGEYYLQLDPPDTPLIGMPFAMPYRWDEGIMLYGGDDETGFALAFTEGSYDRYSSTGIAPAVTARLHAKPTEGLYVSASGHYAHDTPMVPVCFSGTVLTPVGGGTGGASPSPGIDALLGSLDARWQVTEAFDVQASAGIAQLDDDAPTFDREFVWWILEPSIAFCEDWRATMRWSGVSTLGNDKGYRFEGRPYGNGAATYGWELMRAHRVALGVMRQFTPALLTKVEVGFDHFEATTASGLPNDTRNFVAAEVVLSF